MARKIEEERKEQIRQLRDEGCQIAHIRRVVKCSYDTAFRVMYDAEYMNWRESVADRWKEILELFGKEEAEKADGSTFVRKKR